MTNKAKPKIVVVDNSPSIKALFERGTAPLDVELLVYESADKSWSYLEANKPDLLFLNNKMPGKDGLILLKELRELPLHKDTAVVMISSKDYSQDRTIASQLGAVAFVTKPMPVKVITDIVLKYIKTDHGQ